MPDPIKSGQDVSDLMNLKSGDDVTALMSGMDVTSLMNQSEQPEQSKLKNPEKPSIFIKEEPRLNRSIMERLGEPFLLEADLSGPESLLTSGISIGKDVPGLNRIWPGGIHIPGAGEVYNELIRPMSSPIGLLLGGLEGAINRFSSSRSGTGAAEGESLGKLNPPIEQAPIKPQPKLLGPATTNLESTIGIPTGELPLKQPLLGPTAGEERLNTGRPAELLHPNRMEPASEILFDKPYHDEIVRNAPSKTAEAEVIPRAGQAVANTFRDINPLTANVTSADQTLASREITKPIADTIITAQDEKVKWIATTERELSSLTEDISDRLPIPNSAQKFMSPRKRASRILLGMLVDGKPIESLPSELVSKSKVPLLELQERANRARVILDQVHEMFPEGATKGGENVGYLENYFTHIQNQPEDFRSSISNILDHHFGIFKSKEITIPEAENSPVPAGHIRLYRGEPSRYVETISGDTIGRWFSEDFNQAKKYTVDRALYDEDTYKPTGKIKYVDIPINEYQKLKNIPSDTDVVLPRNYLSQLKEIDYNKNPSFGTGDLYEKGMGHPSSPFIEERTGKNTDLQYDVNKVFPAYIESASKVIFDKPAVESATKMLDKIPDSNLKELAKWYVKNYSRYDAEKGLSRAWTQWASTMARTTARSLLSLNTGLQSLHLARVIGNLYPELGGKYTTLGLKKLAMNPIESWTEAAKLGLLQNEIRPFRFKTPLEKIDSIGNFLSLADYIDKTAGYFGYKEKFLRAGMDEKTAQLQALRETKRVSQTVDAARKMKAFSNRSNIIGGEVGSTITTQFKQVPAKIIEQYVRIANQARENPKQAARMLAGVSALLAANEGLRTFHLDPWHLMGGGMFGALGTATYSVAKALSKGDVITALKETMLWATPGGKSIERQLTHGPSALQ